ncbi:MAG: hypothetical protein AB7O50_08435 [Pseudolabrys sp.]
MVPFVPRAAPSSEWRDTELRDLASACAGPLTRGEISGWERGATEAGDPQLYVLGPAPEHECLLCISRLGHSYVLEDGQGRLLSEHDAIAALASQVRTVLGRKKAAVFGRLVAAWLGIRGVIEEEIEPLIAEPLEVVSHVAPQLTALI